jgi:peptide/nickel transport system permease protein
MVADSLTLAVPVTPVRRSHARLLRSLELWIPVGMLVLIVLACFLGPYVLPIPGPGGNSLGVPRLPLFSPGHLLGTDALGEDLLSRSLYGGRVSIEVGLGSVALGLLVGGALGVLAGFKGRVLDAVIMRVLDMFLAFPSLVLALAVATYLGPDERNVIFAIAFFTIPAYARLARAATLKLRESNFILSSDLIGARDRYTIVRHVVPNIAGQLLTFGLLTVGVAMIIEAALSFLGLGVRPPEPTWGNMISAGQPYLSANPQIALVPAAFLFLTVVSLNLAGDALRIRWGHR